MRPAWKRLNDDVFVGGWCAEKCVETGGNWVGISDGDGDERWRDIGARQGERKLWCSRGASGKMLVKEHRTVYKLRRVAASHTSHLICLLHTRANVEDVTFLLTVIGRF